MKCRHPAPRRRRRSARRRLSSSRHSGRHRPLVDDRHGRQERGRRTVGLPVRRRRRLRHGDPRARSRRPRAVAGRPTAPRSGSEPRSTGASTSSNEYTIVQFEHEGWREPVEFMYHCSTKWATFLMSLKELVETGHGRPAPDDVQDQRLALIPGCVLIDRFMSNRARR